MLSLLLEQNQGMSMRRHQKIYQQNTHTPQNILFSLKRSPLSCFNFVQPRQMGFTLPELLVVIAIIGILAAIVSVSVQGIWNARILAAAQDEVFQAMRQTQVQAIRTRSTWRASFRDLGDTTQWAIHSASIPLAQATWHNLTPSVRIDTYETTLPRTNGIYRVEYDQRGHIQPPLGRLTLLIQNGGNLKRCVFTSTILGALRKAKNRPQPDSSGRYCY
jgi:prepilin-type N-terminal cleavage/methylation domain-containing protein